MSDMYDGFLQAVEYLKKLGHTKIGYLSAFDDSCYYDTRLSAFRTAMRRSLGNNVPYVEYGSWPYSSSEELGGKLMQQMITEHPDVTAVIATNDLMAIGAMKKAKEMNIQVPKQLSVIGVDNIEKSSLCDPPLTTLDQCGREYGKKIFEILHENIEEQTSGKYIIPMRLIERKSTCEVSEK